MQHEAEDILILFSSPKRYLHQAKYSVIEGFILLLFFVIVGIYRGAVYVCFFMFLLLILTLLKLRSKAMLTLTPEGFMPTGSKQRISWKDVSGFKLVHLRQSYEKVGIFRTKPGETVAYTWSSHFKQKYPDYIWDETEYDGLINNDYDFSNEKLLVILQEWHMRYTTGEVTQEGLD